MTAQSRPVNQLRTFLDMIKFEHTIFALPFAYIGMVLAAGEWPSWWDFFWITVAMASARTLAMAVNRAADAAIDARNPRTANRPIPAGKMSVGTVWAVAALSLVIFGVAAWNLHPFVRLLAPLALFALIFYSYTKRFTWLSHWWLGVTDGAAAAGGWAAVRGDLGLPAWLLWGAVTAWIAGFDLIYACQDVEFDRAEGLHSFPRRFGVAAALNMARLMHVLTALLLAAAGYVTGLGWPYWIAWAIAAALLAYENSLVRPDDLSKVDLAFFTVNGYIAIIVFVGVLLGVYIG